MGCDLHSPRKISNFAVAMYKHLNSAQRYAIFSLLANKISFSKIAKTLSFPKSFHPPTCKGTNGVIQVEALNSNGKAVRCRLSGNTQAIETVQYQNTDAQKTLREGQLFIEKNNKTYNTQGITIK